MKKHILLTFFCTTIISLILKFPYETINTTKQCLVLWFNSVFPSLFPFFVLTSIIKQTGMIEFFIYKTKLNYNLFFITLIGLICGYPSTSKLIGQTKGLSNCEEIYALSTSPNPIFVVGTVCTVFLNQTNLAFYILPAIYLSLISSYFICKFIFKKEKQHQAPLAPKLSEKPFGEILMSSILDGFTTQFTIIGIIILSSIISLFLTKLHIFEIVTNVLYPLLQFLKIPRPLISPFLSGLVEMTSGNNTISQLNISYYHKIICCTFLTSFGGFAIITESLAFINNKIKATHIITIKLIHGVLSVVYVRLLLFIFPLSNSVFYNASIQSINYGNFLFLNIIISILIYAVLKIISKQH